MASRNPVTPVDEAYEIVIRPRSAISLADAADVWRHRELLWTLARRDIAVRYKQAALGAAWALLQPLTQMFVFTILFNRFAGIRGDAAVPYPLFCFAGLVVWLLFSTGVTQASASLVDNANLVTKVYFPRAVMPAASVLAALADFFIAFVLLVAMLVFYRQGFHSSLLLAPLIALDAALCALALGLWLAALNLQFRDVRYVLPFFIQTMIFVTPVFYPPSLAPEKYRALLSLNPMTAVVASFRAAAFGEAIPWAQLGIATAIALVVAAAGFLFFRRMETTFADRI
jgi:lipopolysaccharide transport system permease protein